jgi:putative ABC transport system permease protein
MLQDLRYAFRMMAKSPGVTALAVLAMALGIGANTAIFSVVNGVLLRRLPYKDPDRLCMVWMDNRRLGLKEDLTSYPNFQDWKQNQSFEDMAGYTTTARVLVGDGEPERVLGAAIPSNFLPLLGVSPVVGRNFTPEDEVPGKDNVALIGHGLWMRRFGGDPNVVGKAVPLASGGSMQIIGVLPEGFRFPTKESELWTPLAVPDRAKQARGGFWMWVVGRLKPGVELEPVRAEMTGIGKRLEEQYPNTNRGLGVWVVPLKQQLLGPVQTALWVLFGAVVFVLLIACANVANLFLAGAADREREMSVRAALGAGRVRLVRQLLTESMVLALAAGALGLVLALWGVDTLRNLAPKDLPRLEEIGIDWRVLAFTFAASVATGILFGLAPALKAGAGGWGVGVRVTRSAGTARALVVGEVALAVVLLGGAGLLIRSFARLLSVDPGFRTERLLTFQMSFSSAKYPGQGPHLAVAYDQLIQRIQALPGVEAAAGITDIFLSTTPNSGNFTVEGAPVIPLEQQIEATDDVVTPDYFRVMGVPLKEGRWFSRQDGPESPPVVIINETMARRFWPEGSPVGKRFKFGQPDSKAPWLTVVGVAGDMRRQGLHKSARAETFLPLGQRFARSLNLVVRTKEDPLALAGAVRAAVRELDSNAPVSRVTTLERLIGESTAQRRFQMLLLALFAGLALALAAIGVYGMNYYYVTQRTQEIGVRMALGAQREDLIRLVLGRGVRLVAAGAVLGLAAALALGRVIESLLFAVGPRDLTTLTAVVLVIGVFGLLASYLPARRATKVDPMVALRYE